MTDHTPFVNALDGITDPELRDALAICWGTSLRPGSRRRSGTSRGVATPVGVTA